jgi:hypothetical protein
VRANGLLANDDQLMRDALGSGPGVTSYGGGGLQADNLLRRADLSDDGLVIAFISTQPLLASDLNGEADVYVRDLLAGTTTRVTNTTTGPGPRLVAISGDARVVVFESTAPGLVPGDGVDSDLFMWTRATGTLRKLTASLDGGSNGGGTFRSLDLSRDGRAVFFSSSAPDLVAPAPQPANAVAVYRWDEGLGVSLVHAAGAGGACSPAIVGGGGSGDGTTSTFMTTAGVLPQDTNGLLDAYASRVDAGPVLASLGPSGSFDAGPCGTAVAQWPEVSFDGSRMVFELTKSVLAETSSQPHVVVRDLASPGFVVVSPGDAGVFLANASRFPFVDHSGQRVSFVSNAGAVPGPPVSVFSYRCFLSELNGRSLARITPLLGDVDAGFPACVAAKISGNGHAVLVVTPSVQSPFDRASDGGAADLDLYLRLLP